MTSVHNHFRRTDAVIWGAIGLVAMAVIGATLLTPLKLELRTFLAPAACAVLLSAGGWYYRSLRNEQRLGAILIAAAQIIGFAAVAAPLSYVAATAGFPLQDALFDKWDHQLHFDWSEMIAFLSMRPGLQSVLHFAYSSFVLQSVTTLLALGMTGQLVRLATFVTAFISTTLITIAMSAVFPAAGPWLFLDLQPAMANGFLPVSSTSWPVFLGLRDGTFQVIQGMNLEGIITFPSLHAALGILFAIALWRVNVVKWIALGLNGLMLIATPAYGSHYVVDVIAGVLVAVACWVAVARLFAAASETTSEHVPTSRDAPSIVPDALPQPSTAAALSQDLESA